MEAVDQHVCAQHLVDHVLGLEREHSPLRSDFCSKEDGVCSHVGTSLHHDASRNDELQHPVKVALLEHLSTKNGRPNNLIVLEHHYGLGDPTNGDLAPVEQL